MIYKIGKNSVLKTGLHIDWYISWKMQWVKFIWLWPDLSTNTVTSWYIRLSFTFDYFINIYWYKDQSNIIGDFLMRERLYLVTEEEIKDYGISPYILPNKR